MLRAADGDTPSLPGRCAASASHALRSTLQATPRLFKGITDPGGIQMWSRAAPGAGFQVRAEGGAPPEWQNRIKCVCPGHYPLVPTILLCGPRSFR
jgi:hypothetical protein